MTTCVNFHAQSHQQIYNDVVANAPGSSDVNRAASDWRTIATDLGPIRDYVERALGGVRASREGAAADAATSAISPLAPWISEAQRVAGQVADRVEEQANYFQTTSANMPEPVKIRDGGWKEWPIIDAFTTSDQEIDEARAREAEARARELMVSYQNNTNSNLLAMPEFTPPPSLQGNVDTSSGEQNQVGTSSRQIPTTSTYSTGDRGSSLPDYGGGSKQQIPETKTDPVWQKPGPVPPQNPGPVPPTPTPTPSPSPIPNPNPGPIPPRMPLPNPYPGPTGPGGPGGPGSPQRTPTGPGGGGGRVGGVGGGGFGGRGGLGAGGFGAGGRGGFGPGGGFGAGAGGFGPGAAGGLAGEGAAGRGGFGPGGGAMGAGGVGGAGAVGRGAAGMGMGAMGAGARGAHGGDDDKEHRRPDYLVETEDVFGDGQRVAPPVIGE